MLHSKNMSIQFLDTMSPPSLSALAIANGPRVRGSMVRRQRQHPNIRAVFFDLGGTLVDAPNLPRCVELLDSLGLPLDTEAFVHSYRFVERAHDRLDGSPAGMADFWCEVVDRAAGHEVSRPIISELLRRYESSVQPPPVFSDARRCLESLAHRRLALGVISNSRSKEQVRAILGDAGLLGFFGPIVSSGTEGVSKPDPEIFRRAADRVAAPAEACAHVGDLPNTDARAALRAGFHGVWLNRFGTGFGGDPPEITSLLELPRWLAQFERRSR